MREYDDNIQHYAPVLRRIIILVAVITAVPVVMWTITAFMRTYIAQPTIPDARPLAAVTAPAAPANPPVETATITPAAAAAAGAAPAQPAPAVVEARATATDARSSDTDTKADRMRDGAANAAPTDVKPIASAMAQPTSTVAPAVTAPPPAVVSVLAAPAGSAPDVFPNPATATVPAAADDALPPPDPIAGPVPLPRHRPSVFASAETGVPLPRARPGDAPEPSSTVTDTQSGYEPGISGR
jgi:hypothetical protein